MSRHPSSSSGAPPGEAAREARRRERGTWPVQCHRLGEEPRDDLVARTSAGDRLAMVWPLTVVSWRLSGRPLPDYARSRTPARLFRTQPSQ